MMDMIKNGLFTALTMLLLAGCYQDAGPGYAIHDSKYSGITQNGDPMAADAGPGPCVLDSWSGLIWEVKTGQPGLQDWRNTYSWYNPNEQHGELDYRGSRDGGQCTGSDCDTWDYIRAVNDAGLCGYRDWRLPLRDELASISDPRKAETPPTFNQEFFPFGQPDEYWSANDYQFRWDAAWVWNYQFGHDRVDWKKEPKRVRLVRGEALNLDKIKD